MTRDRLLAELRAVLDDEIANYGWSDIILLPYLAEGQDVFCEETGYFTDATTYTITTEAGVASYSLSDRVIKVLDIYYGTKKLGKFQEEDKTVVVPPGFPQTFVASQTTPYAWQADYATGNVTLYPTPDGVYTLTLRVWRYAINDLAGDDINGDPAQPEIPSALQRACVEYAAYKALMHHDKEQQDPVKAREHYSAFMMYVHRGKNALNRRQATEIRVGGNPLYVV